MRLGNHTQLRYAPFILFSSLVSDQKAHVDGQRESRQLQLAIVVHHKCKHIPIEAYQVDFC